MPRQRMLFIVAILAALLAACSTLGNSAPATPTPAPGKYDGSWQANVITANGLKINLFFRVSNSVIRWMTYTYNGQAGQTCTALIPSESLPAISGDGFAVTVVSATSSNTVSIIGRFNSSAMASGNITFAEANTERAYGCVANVNAKWSAAKQQEAAATLAPGTTAWCGENVNCSNLLIQLLIFGLVNGAILALNAIGVTVIYSTVRTINLAHGDVFALTTVLITSSINMIGLDPDWPMGTRLLVLAGVLLAAILFGALLSLGVEEAAFRPFRGRSRLAPIIASLGLSFILYQGSLIWRAYQQSFVRGEHRSVPGLNEVPTDGIPNFFPAGNLLHSKVVLQFSDVFVFAAAILFVLIVTYILLRTRLGRSIRAVAQDEELAQIVGVNRDGAIRRAFVLGGALAGVAAFVFALYYSRPFGQAGAESGLTAFAAALLGGIGSPVGALMSGLLLSVSSSFSDYFLSAQWTPVLVLGLLTVLLFWQRGGLLGHNEDTTESGTRDSVVLTASASSQNAKRWLIPLFIALAILPVLSDRFNWGSEILLRGLGIFILLTLGTQYFAGPGRRSRSRLCHELRRRRIRSGHFDQPLWRLRFHVGGPDQRRHGRIVRPAQRNACDAYARRLSGRGNAGAGPDDAGCDRKSGCDWRPKWIQQPASAASLRADGSFTVRTVLSRPVLCPDRGACQRTIDRLPHRPRLDRFVGRRNRGGLLRHRCLPLSRVGFHL